MPFMASLQLTIYFKARISFVFISLKVRKMCNENSVIIASDINDRIKRVGRNQYIPNIDNQIEIKESTDLKNLDHALSKFDKPEYNKNTDNHIKVKEKNDFKI